MKAKCFVISLLLISRICCAQQNVIQLGIESKDRDFSIINLKENGVLLIDRVKPYLFSFQKIDTTLQKEWKIDLEVSPQSQIYNRYTINNSLYLLFIAPRSNFFEVAKIATNLGASQSFKIPMPVKFSVHSLQATDDKILLLGSVDNVAYLIIYTISTNTSKLISINTKEARYLQSMTVDDDRIYISSVENSIKKSSLSLEIYNLEGQRLKNKLYTHPNGGEFLSSTMFVNNGHKYLIGNYGDYYSDQQVYNSVSNGLYVLSLEKSEESSVQTIEFSQLKHSLDFLNKRARERIEAKNKRKIDNGKDVDFDYQVHIGSVISRDNKIIITAEVVKPLITTENTNNYFPMSMRQSYFTSFNHLYRNLSSRNDPFLTISRFSGFDFLSGMVICIDSLGILNWDQSVKYRNVTNFGLTNHLHVVPNSEGYVLEYNVGKTKVRRFLDQQGEFIKEPQIPKVDSKVESTSLGHGVYDEYWYDNNFLTWEIVPNRNKNLPFSNVCIIEKVGD
ncbi:MAG: hypothetical protein ACRCVT_15250 [Leadbetterella sp.]